MLTQTLGGEESKIQQIDVSTLTKEQIQQQQIPPQNIQNVPPSQINQPQRMEVERQQQGQQKYFSQNQNDHKAAFIGLGSVSNTLALQNVRIAKFSDLYNKLSLEQKQRFKTKYVKSEDIAAYTAKVQDYYQTVNNVSAPNPNLTLLNKFINAPMKERKPQLFSKFKGNGQTLSKLKAINDQMFNIIKNSYDNIAYADPDLSGYNCKISKQFDLVAKGNGDTKVKARFEPTVRKKYRYAFLIYSALKKAYKALKQTANNYGVAPSGDTIANKVYSRMLNDARKNIRIDMGDSIRAQRYLSICKGAAKTDASLLPD